MAEGERSRGVTLKPRDGIQRILLIAVIAMGVLIVFGVVAIVGRIAYLASGITSSSSQTGVVPTSRLDLPAGAEVRSLALDGRLLAVHFASPSGNGIAIVDIETGRTISRLTVNSPEP